MTDEGEKPSFFMLGGLLLWIVLSLGLVAKSYFEKKL